VNGARINVRSTATSATRRLASATAIWARNEAIAALALSCRATAESTSEDEI